MRSSAVFLEKTPVVRVVVHHILCLGGVGVEKAGWGEGRLAREERRNETHLVGLEVIRRRVSSDSVSISAFSRDESTGGTARRLYVSAPYVSRNFFLLTIFFFFGPFRSILSERRTVRPRPS